MLRSIVALVMCAALFACGESEQEAVQAQYQRGEDAIRIGDFAEYRSTMTPESIDSMQEDLRLAVMAKESETRALRPSRMAAVIALRNRVNPESLKKMTVDQYFTWLIDQELMVVDEDYGILTHSVIVHGDQATLRRGIVVEDDSYRSPRVGRRGRGLAGGIARAVVGNKTIERVEGMELYFVNLGGYWYHDALASEGDDDDFHRMLAEEEGMGVVDYLLANEESEHGSLKPNIWAPIGK